MKKKPVIAITGPDRGGFTAWFFTWLAVKRAGGLPMRVHPSNTEILPNFDGLIIGGGADINPDMYDASPIQEIRDLAESQKPVSGLRRFLHITVGVLIVSFRKMLSLGHTAPVDSNRDELEKKILKKAVQDAKPVLGICRGMQFINVHFGGNLHQDIREFYGETPKVDSVYPKKQVRIKPGSKLAGILAADMARVNSLHNQAVDVTGRDIEVVAKEITGIAQAIEHRKMPFMIGIQWHPEYLPQIDKQQRLFRRLVELAGAEKTSVFKDNR